jgi:hypothetical protein
VYGGDRPCSTSAASCAFWAADSFAARKLLDQMELEDLVATAAEEVARIELRGKGERVVAPHTRCQPVRKPLPEHPLRERAVVLAPSSCPCCGSSRPAKLGEDVTETLEVIPRQWKAIQCARDPSDGVGLPARRLRHPRGWLPKDAVTGR